MMEYIVVTGVSSGIGYDVARYLTDKGFYIFGSVRTQTDADRTKADFGTRFTPLIFDVTDRDGVNHAVEQVRETVGRAGIKALVNNAGITVFGPLADLSPEDLRHQLDVNVVGAFSVTHAFLPLLGTDPQMEQSPGRIVNISSVSGRIAYPFLGAYAASKYALEALSDALRRELKRYDIDVILIEPGNTVTPILDKTKAQFNRFQTSDYASILDDPDPVFEDLLESAIPVEVVSQVIHQAITSKKPKARYPLPNRWISEWYLLRLLPARIVDSLLARAFGIIT